MTNSRGTRFSTKHVNLTINDYAFWDFSFHEIGLYDLRASLKYIYRKSNQRKIIVIGHSMGSTESLIYASMFPEEAKKLSHVFILMGPTSSLKYIKGRIFAQLIPFLQEYAEKERLGVAFWKSSTMADIVHNMCPHIPDFCITVFNFVGAGWAEEEENPPAAALILTQHPRAMSYKSIFHYGQFVSSGKFQMFDYGQKNIETYGKLEPPEYPIEQIKAPIFLVYSPSDNFAPEKDIDNLYQRLPGISKIYGKLRIEKMNHIDIIMGKHRKEKIYYKIEDLLNKL
ncbi:hypothetical protein HHI36_012843 [Cryptolaemus montrouzieri]|uniref:AB hydrolase-1 domain-containing protein n=1 Tax=Cryptolaemus montrouzieri TaxID=559131 RepID=A0ABD2NGI9_9CUCU